MVTETYAELFGRALAPSEGPGDATDDLRERILVAAREQYRRFGIRRSSIEDVARRAGTSRITVYRRFPSKDALVEEVLLAELREFFASFREVVGRAPTAADRLAEGFALALSAARQNSLAGGLMTTEPHVVMPFLVGDDRVLGAVREFVAGQLRREQEAGEIGADVDVRVVAELLARITLSFFLTPGSCVDLDDAAQVRDVAYRFLAPLATGGNPPPDGRRRGPHPSGGSAGDAAQS